MRVIVLHVYLSVTPLTSGGRLHNNVKSFSFCMDITRYRRRHNSRSIIGSLHAWCIAQIHWTSVYSPSEILFYIIMVITIKHATHEFAVHRINYWTSDPINNIGVRPWHSHKWTSSSGNVYVTGKRKILFE